MKQKLLIPAAVVLPFLLISFVRVAGFSAENSVDCYYHVYMSDRGPLYCSARQFPELTMSIWNHSFSDKELGFHLLLSGLRTVKRTLSCDMTPPFDLEALFFAYIVILAFVYVLHFFRIRNILIFSILLVIASPFFTDRLLMLRPHNLSIALMLLTIPLFCSIKTKKELWKIFLFAALTSWCYSNPHFLLLPALTAGSIYFFRKQQKIHWHIPLSVFCGLIAGYIIHPQFPNTFINWKIQCIDVPLQIIFKTLPVSLGMEFRRPTLLWLFKNAAPFIFFFFSLFMIWKLYPKKERSFRLLCKTLPVHLITAGIISFITLAGTLAGIRAMEYAAPFTLIFTAFIINEYRVSEIPLPYPFNTPNTAKYTKILIGVLAFTFVVFQTRNYTASKGFPPMNDFALWAQQHRLKQTDKRQSKIVIANLIWSDFPFLIYSTPQFRYLSGLDPMFSYAAYPATTKKLALFQQGKITITPAELAELTGAHYAFIRKPYKRFAKQLKQQEYKLLYEGEDGWLFEL